MGIKRMTAAAQFVHLHNHTEYSLLDGISKISDIVSRLKSTGMEAFALTDHGNLYGAVRFYDQMAAAGLKPIIGCETYVALRKSTDRDGEEDRYSRHLVLLCESLVGYRNLLKLVTHAWTEGYYYRPRIDFEVLSQHHEGLIALSSCLSGVVNAPLRYEGEEAAEREIARYAELFGPGRFYLELQNHGLPEEQKAIEFNLRMARKHNLRVVATNDSHYVNPEDAEAHDIALCLQTSAKFNDPGRMRFTGTSYYIKTPKEMAALFAEAPHALNTALDIAERCQVDLTDTRVHFPTFEIPPERPEQNLDDYLRALAYAGAREFYGDPLPPEVVERLDEELSVIISTGFSALFLLVWDLMRFAREQHIPVGPGRGSAAGSLVSYCLRITKLDPLKYGLFFERFLNKERVELPDFDLDFCYERREEMIDYVRRRYGEGCVAQIITFSTLKARAAVKAVGRVKDFEFPYVNRITKLITGVGTIQEAVERSPELSELLQKDPAARELVELSQKLEGLASHVSVHAAGIVVADRPLVEYAPLRAMKDTDMPVTQYEMSALARVGLLKLDFLGLKTLTTIDKCVRRVREVEQVELDIDRIPLDDERVYEGVFWRGNCFGVFQFEAPHIVSVLREARPRSIEDLTALNALNRPGPLRSGMDAVYTQNRKHPERAAPPLPELEPVFSATGGVLLYQEQVMQIARLLAGYTLGEADVLRKAMGKKILSLMAQHKTDFIERAVGRGVGRRRAEEIWDMMDKFAGYGFNKAHAACYALLAYQTAFLKHYHPHHFLAALMNTYIHDSTKITASLDECKRQGIEVVPPSVNLSEFDFVSDGQGRIIFGLGGIKHVGRVAVEELVSERREGGPYSSVEELLERVDGQKVNKTALEYMVRAGAFDEFGVDRGELLQNLDSYLSRRVHHNQIAMFDAASSSAPAPARASSPVEIARMEKESIGVYLTHNPYENARVLADRSIGQLSALFQRLAERGVYMSDAKVRLGGVLDGVKALVSRRKQQYALARLCSLEHTLNLVVGPSVYQKVADILLDGNEVVVQGSLGFDEAAEETFDDLAGTAKLYVAEMALYRPQPEGRPDAAEEPAGPAPRPCPGRVLLKLRRPFTPEELRQLKELLAGLSGECPVYLLIPSEGGAARKIALSPKVSAPPDLHRRVATDLPLDVEFVAQTRLPRPPGRV